MAYRRIAPPNDFRRILLFAMVAMFGVHSITAFLIGNQRDDAVQRSDGPYQVVDIIDAVNFIVVSLQEDPGSADAKPFTFRLTGVTLRPEDHQSAEAAGQWVRRFLGRPGDSNTETTPAEVELQFDRVQTAPDQVVVGYLVMDQRCLNVELVRAGLADAELVRGSHSPWGREIRQADSESVERMATVR